MAVDSIARLGIEVTSKDVIKAQKRLDKLEKSGKKAGKSADKLKTNYKTVGLAMTGAAVAAGALTMKIIDQMNTYQNMTNRLKLVTKGSKDLAETQNRLFDISQNTRVSLESTTDLYTRLARSTKSLKISQKELSDITETVNKTLIISGASATSSAAALMQLGQGLSAGAIRGEELNSILEQTPRLAEALEKGLGLAQGALKKYGATGKITTKAFIDAMKSQSLSVDKEFGQMEKTIDQAATQIGNVMLKTFGSTDSGGIVAALDDFREVISDPAVTDGLKSMATGLIEIASVLVSIPKMLIEFGDAIGTGLYDALNDTTPRLQQINEELKKLNEQKNELANDINEVTLWESMFGTDADVMEDARNMDTIIEKIRLLNQEKGFIATPEEGDSGKSLDEKLEEKALEYEAFSELDASQSARDLEKLEIDLMNKSEKEQMYFDRKTSMIDAAFLSGQITDKKRNKLLEGLERKHQDQLSKITKKGLTERQRFEQMTMAMQVQTIAGSLSQITAGVAQHNKTLFRINQVAGIANAIVNTAVGITNALASFPPPISFVMAGAQAAAGLVQIMAIKGASFGGGGSAPSVVASGGGGAGAPISTIPVQQQEIPVSTIPEDLTGDSEPQQIFNIEITGNPTGDQVLELMEMIEEQTDENTQFNIMQGVAG